MADVNKPIPRLYLKSTWNPPISKINHSLQRRTGIFLMRLKNLFIKKKVRSNLLPHQRDLLCKLRQEKKFLVIQADKNLGPCIIEREQYIHRALNDHLLDRNTYRKLDNVEIFNKYTTLSDLLIYL
jgi:hypothetical protein